MLNLALADDFGIFNIFNLHLDSTVSELLCIDAYFVRGLIKGFLCRNILSIYLQLNLMDPGKVLFSCQMQNGDTEPNLKYCLKEYFNIV